MRYLILLILVIFFIIGCQKDRMDPIGNTTPACNDNIVNTWENIDASSTQAESISFRANNTFNAEGDNIDVDGTWGHRYNNSLQVSYTYSNCEYTKILNWNTCKTMIINSGLLNGQYHRVKRDTTDDSDRF